MTSGETSESWSWACAPIMTPGIASASRWIVRAICWANGGRAACAATLRRRCCPPTRCCKPLLQTKCPTVCAFVQSAGVSLSLWGKRSIVPGGVRRRPAENASGNICEKGGGGVSFLALSSPLVSRLCRPRNRGGISFYL